MVKKNKSKNTVKKVIQDQPTFSNEQFMRDNDNLKKD
jgi:hypothetical protein